MNISQDNLASRVGISAVAWARRRPSAVHMSKSDRIATSARALRVLIPINANDDSQWGLRYAVRRKREGVNVEVILLHVGEPILQWQVLRFRTQQEIAAFQAERARFFIEDAKKRLMADEVSCRGIFRQGELVFAILDTAEEMDCDEIIMPLPKKGLPGLFARRIVDAVKRQQRDVPVVAVNSDGVTPQYSLAW